MIRTPSGMAGELIDRHWDALLPVNPVKLADPLQIAIRRLEAEQDDVIAYAAMEGSTRVIAYRTDMIPERKRFALAHTMGHHVLGHVQSHLGRLLDVPEHYSVRCDIARELEANRFALALLMPEKAVLMLVERKGLTSITALASAFDVAEIAMHERLKMMGLAR